MLPTDEPDAHARNKHVFYLQVNNLIFSCVFSLNCLITIDWKRENICKRKPRLKTWIPLMSSFFGRASWKLIALAMHAISKKEKAISGHNRRSGRDQETFGPPQHTLKREKCCGLRTNICLLILNPVVCYHFPSSKGKWKVMIDPLKESWWPVLFPLDGHHILRIKHKL